MEVREFDFKKDTGDAVNLFNRSFSHKISRDYFEWKHKDNPFGRSYGLVAIIDEKMVGLRMFMRWKFSSGDVTFDAIRPVDTCTDPKYQGKGIFKMLTLQGLEKIKDEYDFVFNTPNSNSIKGYLKMGWKKTERLFGYNISLANPFSSRKKFHIIEINQIEEEFLSTCNNEFSTQLSNSYLRWRYRFSKYSVAKFDDGTIIIFRLEKIRKMKVLFLMEFCGANENINSYIDWLALTQGAFLIYYLRNEKFRNRKFLLTLKRGEQDVVIKNDEKFNFRQFNFSAGDLEAVL